MARSPDIARRGDRFAYDRPKGAVVQAGDVKPEAVRFGHRFQDLPPGLGGEGLRYFRLDRRVPDVFFHVRGEPGGR